MATETGILVLQVGINSSLQLYLKPNDVMLMFNVKITARLSDLQAAFLPPGYKGIVELVIFRDQQGQHISAEIK